MKSQYRQEWCQLTELLIPKFTIQYFEQLIRHQLPDNVEYSARMRSALALAFAGHDGQYRESPDPGQSKIPYITHPVGVSLIAINFFDQVELRDSLEDVVACCLTHDILEDTEVSLIELGNATSRRVADLVLAMTKPPVANALSRDRRNQMFLEQISNAGKTASFIKICDALHNISRPRQMPEYLLAKTINKLDQSYRKLLNHFEDTPVLSQEFQRRIDAAREVLSKQNVSTEPRIALSVSDAAEKILERARTKAIELHDLPELLKNATNAYACEISSAAEFVDSNVIPFLKAKSTSVQSVMRSVFGNESKGLLLSELKSGHPFGAARSLIGIDLRLSSEADRDQAIFFALDKSAPEWVERNTLSLFVSTLLEQYRTKERLRLSELVQELSLIDLTLDPALALEADLNYAALRSIKARLDSANFIYRSLLSAIEQVRSDNSDRILVESVIGRVKSADSTVQKMLTRRINLVSEIDDLVGIRVVCASSRDASEFLSVLESHLRDPSSVVSRSVGPDHHTVELRDVQTSSGYSGKHICFQTQSPLSGQFDVSCEIQIRTVFADAAARFTHVATYKKKNRKNLSKSKKAVLSEIRSTIDRLEELAMKLG